jgi:pre-mycofactocin synthase
MRAGIDSALLGLGRATTAELSPEDLIIPSGFTRALGPVQREHAAAEPV